MEFRALTPEQSRFFEENGYLVVPGALDGAMVRRVVDAVDRIYEQGVRQEGLNRVGA